jgi:hypothetical protein
MNHSDDLHADELSSVVEQLRAHRPEATALELDAVKQRVRRRMATGPAGRRARSSRLMKSRLAILSTLVAGMLLSTTGAGLAVTSLRSQHNDAAVAQYGTPTPTPPGGKTGGGVLGEDTSSSPGGVAGESGSGGPAGTGGSGLQPTRQVESGAGSGSLPFTGFLAIPVLIGGIALLSAGLVLRRRAAADDRS